MKKVIVGAAFAAAALALYGIGATAPWNPSHDEAGAAFQHQAEERAAQRRQQQEEHRRFDSIQQSNNPLIDMHLPNPHNVDDDDK